MDDLIKAAQWINKSSTGAIAFLMEGYVMVQVPGIIIRGGKKVQRMYTTEKVYSLTEAIKLIQSME